MALVAHGDTAAGASSVRFRSGRCRDCRPPARTLSARITAAPSPFVRGDQGSGAGLASPVSAALRLPRVLIGTPSPN